MCDSLFMLSPPARPRWVLAGCIAAFWVPGLSRFRGAEGTGIFSAFGGYFGLEATYGLAHSGALGGCFVFVRNGDVVGR